jgi:hypothetical protein
MSDNGKPVASAQFAMWKQHPNVYAEPTHEDWLHENDRLRTQLADATRKLEEARKAVKAMVEDGWLMHGPEGMSEPQQICYDVYQAIEQGKGGDDAN